MKALINRRLLYPTTLIIALIIWLTATHNLSIGNLIADYWPSAVTMIFGSFVAGSTPLGGGAVAFPVMTKLIGIEASQAKLFSLFIQSVGMSFATLLFISLGIKLYWRMIMWLLPGSTLGLAAGLLWLPVDGQQIKLVFSVMVLVTGILLIKVHNKDPVHKRSRQIPRRYLLMLGLPAGLLAALVGAGADTLLFFLLVIVFGRQAQNVIPTTVCYMAACSLIGSIIVLTSDDIAVSNFVENSWLLAAPIVAVGAPLGGYVMSRANPKHLLVFIKSIILLEGVSTLIFTSLGLFQQLLLLTLIVAASLYFSLQFNQIWYTSPRTSSGQR